jgi:hypothetical protein
VAGLNKPDELTERIANSVGLADGLVDEIQSALLGGHAPFGVRYRYDPLAKTFAGVNIGQISTSLTPSDPEIGAGRGRPYSPPVFTSFVAGVGNEMVMGHDDEAMQRALAVLQGHDNIEVLSDDPSVRHLVAKIGLDNNLLIVVGLGLEGGDLAPAPLAIGLKAVGGNVLRIRMYLSKEALLLLLVTA